MKYLKTFEAKNPTYKVGNFIVANTLYFIDEDLKYFLYNNVGKIVEIETIPGGQIKKTPTKTYIVKYENIPEELKTHFKQWAFGMKDGKCYYTLHTNDFSLATPEEIAKSKYNL